MSIYESEYRRYYSELKKRSSVKKDIQNTSVSDYLPRYSTNIYGGKKGGQVKGSSFINMFIFELIGTLILVLFVFISKNSTNVEIKEYYNYFENGIRADTFETESIIESINRYLDFNESSIIQEKNL